MTCVCAISNTSNTTSNNTSSPTHHNPHYSSYVFSSPSVPSASSSPSPSFLSPRRSHQQQLQKREAPSHHVPTTSSVLKKKRPARINIPQVSSFVNFANGETSLVSETMTEQGEERVGEIEGDGQGYAVYSKRGRRRTVLEDRFSALVLENHTIHHPHGNNTTSNDGNSKKALFGVFDGHGGTTAAEYAASNLGKNILDRLAVPPCSSNTSGSGSVCQTDFHAIKDAVREGYLATDEGFLKQDQDGGACGVTALIQDGNLVVSNVGDCRAVLSRGGVAEPLTVDQRPSREDERTRIEATGGYVDSCNGVWRIQGSLAVSRAIGDRHLKEWVIAEPETRSPLDIQPDCQFLILASDGLWDRVADQEAVDVVASFSTAEAAAHEADGDAGGDRSRNQKQTEDLSCACRKLVELAIRRGSCDDTTVMIIHLGLFANF